MAGREQGINAYVKADSMTNLPACQNCTTSLEINTFNSGRATDDESQDGPNQPTHLFLSPATLLILIAIIFLSSQLAAAQNCLLLPSNPVAVSAGGSYTFSTVNCGTGLTWSLNGPGTISQSGTYTAPASVQAQNQNRGCQELPNNASFNVPVNSLPVDPHSTRWLTRVSQDGTQYPDPDHNIKLYPEWVTFYSNVVNASSQQQPMDFLYPVESNGYEGVSFPFPSQRTAVMESGLNFDPGAGYDRHLFSTSNVDCSENEIYNPYVDFDTVTFTPGNPTQVSWTTTTVWSIPQLYPVVITGGGTGAWSGADGNWRMTPTGNNTGTLPFDSSQWGPAPSGISMSSLGNGCPQCNAQAGQKFSPASYAQLGGVDAAGMPVTAASVKMEEWYAATQAGRTDLGHAIRTTLSNSYLSSRATWPATLYALGVGGTLTQITQATNGNPVVLTSSNDLSQGTPCNNYTYSPGCQFNVNITNIISGPWMALNGDQQATAIDNYHFSVNLNTTNFGPFPGALFVFDFMPYGATIRLMSSVDLDGLCTSTELTDWCPYAKVYLRTLQNYGMVVADGTVPSDNWDNGVVTSEFHPNVLLDAAYNIRNWTGLQPVEPYLEVVQRSSQQLYKDFGRYLASPVNEVTVTVTGSNGSASDDILLQGTTIGTDRERLTVAANTSYQLNVWVHGNVNTGLSYAIDQGIPGSAVSSSGMLTMPSCAVKERGMVTVTSPSDSNALPLYIEVNCLPINSDGSYRLALGNYSGDYTDSQGFTWSGAWQCSGNQCNQWGNPYEVIGLGSSTQAGTWQGNSPCSNDTWGGSDSQLYSRSTSFDGDTKVEVVLPNGTYNVTLYGEPGFGGYDFSNQTCPTTAGQNVYDWIMQGQTIGSWLDGFVLAGNQNWVGYTISQPATVSDNVLDTIGRIRVHSNYGMSWSSVLISPNSAPPLQITTTTLPHAYWVLPYRATLNAVGGTPPYTWSVVAGDGYPPPGYHLNASTGVISGNTPLSGTFSFTVQVTDSVQNVATQPLSLKVCIPGHNC